MVSKASDDLPEPDRPVNTASLSRGISTSMFLRLCSRAPRIVIARDDEPAGCWRLALITSSMRVIPDVQAKRLSKCPNVCSARISEGPNADASDYRRNIGRTSGDFQYRLRIVNGLFVGWRQVAADSGA